MSISPPPYSELIADKYRLVRLIGRGGMGSVWEARHETLGLRVAIKFIEKEYADSKEARSRFDNEAKAAAKIQSKHLIKIFDHGVTADGKPYIVMELLEGEPLDKRIERLGRMPLQDVARMLHQVARGLARAHAEHIIHRDLKPENIFLTQSADDDEEVAKVLDFGIAKIRSTDQTLSNSTKTGAVLGTPYYMSPEQARGLRDIDHRTDVWSLGVIVFKCVTGVLPFEGESLGDLLVKICTAPLPVPSHVLPGLPQSFDVWFSRVLEREPARRFSNVTEAADGLAYLCGVSVRRGPTSGASTRELEQPFRPSSPSGSGSEGAPPRTMPSAGPPAQAFTPPYAPQPMPSHANARTEPGTPVPYPAGTPVPYVGARPNVTATGLAASTPRGAKTSSTSLILGIVVGVVATIVLLVVALRVSPSAEEKVKAAATTAHHPAAGSRPAATPADPSAATPDVPSPAAPADVSANEVTPPALVGPGEDATKSPSGTSAAVAQPSVAKNGHRPASGKNAGTEKPSSIAPNAPNALAPSSSASAAPVKPTTRAPSPGVSPGKQDDNPGY